jgi:hypothetical protein
MTHCPALGTVPSRYVGTDPDLVLKLTPTGVLFLHERSFKKRYIGSKTCAVDINGNLWRSAADLEKEIKGSVSERDKRKGKKKAGLPPCLKLFEVNNSDRCPEGAISEISANQENLSPESAKIATKVAKSQRKKAYTVNKREVRQRILGYINTAKGKKELYFWTVSFPAGTPDATCYQAFNTWLTSLRQRGMLREYLWIAERQLGTRLDPGKAPTLTIHFHIAIPHFMNVHRANAMMRGTLKSYARRGMLPGVVCNPKSKQEYYLPSIAKYNGVDICKNRKTNRIVNFAVKKGSRALATYLTKYVTKNDAGVPDATGEIAIPAFTHLAWHNSRGFSCLFTAVTFTIKEFKDLGFGPFLNRVRQFRMNFATFVPWLYGPPPLLHDHLYKLNSYIQTILQDGR